MSKIHETQYTHRLLARFVIEAKTPLAVGSGQKNILTDSVVALDVNGLPYIPGSSIAGVLRSMIDQMRESRLFGFQKKGSRCKDDEPKGWGSEVIVSEARILNSEGKVMDGLQRLETLEKDPLLMHYLRPMPVRQHVRISHKGVAEDQGKFDQQVVYAGTRFCFEIEIISADGSLDSLNGIISKLNRQSFRIGGGVHNGFGRISVKSVRKAVLDLTKKEDLSAYLAKSSSLDDESFWQGRDSKPEAPDAGTDYVHYHLDLKPDSFFLFGSGYGEEDGSADATTVKAAKVIWKKGPDGMETGVLETGKTLVPATSVKGALRHRVAYHYNRQSGHVIGGENGEPFSAEDCPATRNIFGWQDGKELHPGHILLEDIIEDESAHRLMTHVSIDRFTGGAVNGALFTEQVDYTADRTFELDIYVEKKVLQDTEYGVSSLEAALEDICCGRLPLGGGTNRGNGIFMGKLTKEE